MKILRSQLMSAGSTVEDRLKVFGSSHQMG
jgi:hypothetical protein